MLDPERQLELEGRLAEFLYGQIHLLQTMEQKRKVILDGLHAFLEQDIDGDFTQERELLAQEDEQEKFFHDFVSYGLIQDLLGDFQVEDIVINSLKPIYIHHSKKGLVSTERAFQSKEELDVFIKKLILMSGRREWQNIMDIELPNLEGRINIIQSPFGPQLTITKAKSSPLSIVQLIDHGTLNYEVAAQLWLYLDGMSIRPANIIIAGGPGVGKTTLLNSLLSFIPKKDRVVVMEDTLELNTDFADSCSRLESGDGLTLADLVKNSLRMRPERVVVGEVRGEEARDMITAVNIGKYCIGTIHALTSREAIMRLQNEPMNIPQELVRLIDVFVVLKRYHVGGKVSRVIDEVSETSGMEQEKVLLSHIYKYDYETDTIRAMSTSTVYRDRVAREAGLFPKDVMLEVQLRALLLRELHDRGYVTMKEVTAFCQAYCEDPDKAVKSLGLSRDQLLGEEYMKERRQRFAH